MYLNKNIHTNIPKYLLSIKYVFIYICMYTLTNQKHVKSNCRIMGDSHFSMLIKCSIMNMCYFLNQEIEKL